jgi:CheY-like chemotaxis protein
VVFVDIFMPVQGGLYTIDQLRQRSTEVKIVAMTGVTTVGAVDVKAHAIALGADRFLAKPLEAQELLALIKELTEGLGAS